MKGTKQIAVLVAVASSWSLGPATIATAAIKSWNGGTGSWSVSTNWFASGVPQANDEVRIAHVDGGARTVTYDYTGSPIALGELRINLTGAGATTNTLSMPTNS